MCSQSAIILGLEGVLNAEGLAVIKTLEKQKVTVTLAEQEGRVACTMINAAGEDVSGVLIKYLTQQADINIGQYLCLYDAKYAYPVDVL